MGDSLVTHTPFFWSSADAKQVTFNLLHLSLVREYTQIEFGVDGANVDFERVIGVYCIA